MYQVVGSMNRMVQSYDSAMRNNLEAINRLAEAEARAKEAEKARDAAIAEATEAKLARERAEKEAFVNKENAIRVAERNMKMDSEVVRCKRLLAEAKGLKDSEVARVAQTARRETSEAFTTKLKVVEEKMSLFEDANDQFMYLSQAGANAQLIKALEDGGSLATEKKQVEDWLRDFADAEVNLIRLPSELKEELKAPAPELAPLSPGGHRSVETLADEVGVETLAAGTLPTEKLE